MAPEGYGNDEIQLDLFLDYANNIALYPRFQEYFRTKQPPLPGVWGKYDPVFLPAGAEAFKRDNPAAEVHFYAAGHFPLETHAQEIASTIRGFLIEKWQQVPTPRSMRLAMRYARQASHNQSMSAAHSSI